ncbi:hypothetical protein LCGC14_2847760, partial [marine sediment metagenome]
MIGLYKGEYSTNRTTFKADLLFAPGRVKSRAKMVWTTVRMAHFIIHYPELLFQPARLRDTSQVIYPD